MRYTVYYCMRLKAKTVAVYCLVTNETSSPFLYLDTNKIWRRLYLKETKLYPESENRFQLLPIT